MKFKFLLFVLAILMISCSNVEPDKGGVSGNETGRPSKVWHPMLFFNYYEGEQLKDKLNTSHSLQWQRAKAVADANLKKSPTAFKDDEGEQLWQRNVGNVMSSLSFVGYMTSEQKYFDAAYRWAQASGSYPTWGTDGSPDGQEFGLPYGHQLLGLAMLYDYGQKFLSNEQLDYLRNLLLSRTTRQYAAYSTENLNLIQNHSWINLCGMLASAMVLRNDTDQAWTWVDFVLEKLEQISGLLISDGASQEGPGYWQYGMEFLMMDFDLAESLGKNFWKNSTWWKNTVKYGRYMTLPASVLSKEESIIDFGDAPRASWYGPEHIYRKLAALNGDRYAQKFADESIKYDVSSSWLSVLWYDPSVSSSVAEDFPTCHHFEEMGIWTSRTDWEGNESMIVYRCGAPLGKSATMSSGYNSGDLGHIHPDAGHFIIYSGGEYILKNNGYVKRQTVYHNVALFDGFGQWGEKKSYFTPWPLDPARYPSITDLESDVHTDIISSDMSTAYMEEAGIKTYTRKLFWFKDKNVVIVVDDIECNDNTDVQLLFYPESQNGSCQGSIYTDCTELNKVHIESLTPSSTMTLSTKFIENRSDTEGTETAIVTVSKNIVKERFVTAISWSSLNSTPVEVSYDENKAEITIEDKIITLNR